MEYMVRAKKIFAYLYPQKQGVVRKTRPVLSFVTVAVSLSKIH